MRLNQMVKRYVSKAVSAAVRPDMRNSSKVILRATKYAFCVLIFLSPVVAKAQQAPSLIQGMLLHAGGQTVEISVSDAVFPFRQNLTTNSAGNFSTTLLLHDTTEICLKVNGFPVYFFALPGDSVYLNLDAAQIEPSGLFLQNALVDGKLAGANRWMFDQWFAIQSLAEEATTAAYADPNQAPYDFRSLRLHELSLALDAWNNYIMQFEFADHLFLRWAEAQLRYRAGMDVLEYPMVTAAHQQISDTSAYFIIGDAVPSDNPGVRYFSAWHNYLLANTNVFEYLVQHSLTYKKRRSNLREFGYPAPMVRNQLVLEILLDLPGSAGRSAMLSAFFANQLARQGSLTHYQQRVFAHQIPHHDRLYIQTLLQGKVDWKQRISDWTTNEDLRTELNVVVDAFSGKTVQLCFVSDRCPDCMNTMQVPDGYDLMLLGVYCSLANWEAMPAAQLKFLLSDEAAAFWVVYAGLQHFPTCILLDAEGQM